MCNIFYFPLCLTEMQNCPSSFRKSGNFYQNNDGLVYDGEPHLYNDDTCVVPERLEGKTFFHKLL